MTEEDEAEVTQIIVERIRWSAHVSDSPADHTTYVEGYAEDMAEQIIVGLRLGSWLP